ncbi:unnamed protein product [Darwinula stevensoni]|uniref:Uncharacterized protein n=1 Tax=Darwinula stevensoni TaxID=69355 RepID=A0A7R9A882_9CRUS|nr:unnamed protein product [Darwinula stevensoni]CAG0896128.1 unnamed protein product [Darwinula stevensoni]
MQKRFVVPSLFCLLLPSIRPTTGQYPCPNPEDISPCACSALEDKVYVSCFNTTSSDDIFSAFNNAFWPVTNLTGFHLGHNFDVHEISERMFGDISFEGIGTDWCGVVSVRPSALMPSKDRLEYISMNRGVLEQFPWDYMQHFTKLVAIDFKYNWLTVLPPVQSTSLERLVLAGNPITTLEAGSFMPNLKDINLCEFPLLMITAMSRKSPQR